MIRALLSHWLITSMLPYLMNGKEYRCRPYVNGVKVRCTTVVLTPYKQKCLTTWLIGYVLDNILANKDKFV